MDYTGMYQEILLSIADDERSDRDEEPTSQSSAEGYNAVEFPATNNRQSRGRRRQRTFQLWAGAMMRWLHTAATNTTVISPQQRPDLDLPSKRPWWAPWRTTLIPVPITVLSRPVDGHSHGCNTRRVRSY
jgi:hypothetical protein